MLCLASCAAFCRSAKLGSLNPLIERALSLSWFGVGRLVWDVWCGTNGRIGAEQRRLLDLERCTAARAGKPTIIRLTTPIRNKKNAVYPPNSSPSILRSRRSAPAASRRRGRRVARIIATLNDSSVMAYIAQRGGGVVWVQRSRPGDPA